MTEDPDHLDDVGVPEGEGRTMEHLAAHERRRRVEALTEDPTNTILGDWAEEKLGNREAAQAIARAMRGMEAMEESVPLWRDTADPDQRRKHEG